ncbi:hypothetical protein POJ06DRAFT_247800 [Lipomyces tetrasporus]|uniref:Glutamyl-tRNA amidotransferase complex subunit Gta3 domain-containing protein n=1 Tax=Lipomyces tetrasporus TaxID=54092 RepID=A0AAD7VU81_9ASCO|nr:uncharacterized protein POJ06DRAFT_247800 [Lipomyces tetrasporus]KAJ8101756.1 hypothetical protein POJ06DRAFT_247800 [Lipomyces tetrasporus]
MRIVLLSSRFVNVSTEYARALWCRRRLDEQFRRNSTISITKKIETAVELESLLSKPTWAIQSLLPESTPENRHEDINPQSLRDLLRRSGLQFPKDAEEEAKMLSDLQRQLVFVDHVQDVDTEGVEPLNRIGEYGEELQWDDVQVEPKELLQTVKDKRSIREHMERTFFYVKDREDK